MDFVGGQAVVEGVLIKDAERIAIAVRTPSGKIEVKEENGESITKKYEILDAPLIRGPVILLETLIMGWKALD